MHAFSKCLTVVTATLLFPFSATASETPKPAEMFKTFCVDTQGSHEKINDIAQTMNLEELEGRYARAMITEGTEGKVYVLARNAEELKLLTLATTELNTCALYTQGYDTMNDLQFMRESFDLTTIKKNRRGMETIEFLVPSSTPKERPAMFEEGMYTFVYPDDPKGSIIGYTPAEIAMKAGPE
jgi:hypothetical protein